VDRNDRNILILGILVLILLAVGYYFLLFSPLRQEYLTAYEQRTQKEQQKAQLEQKVAQLENVRRNAPDIERQILEISKRIPEQDEIPTLVVQIEEIAHGTGVTQFSIEPGAPEAPPGGGDFSRIPITMTFTGTYEDMQDFLLRLRNLARLVTVNEVSYCRPDPVSDADCPFDIEGDIEGGGGGRTTPANREIEDQLRVQVLAEVYVQPAAGGEGTTAGGATTPGGGEPAGAGEAKGGGKGGGEAKGGGKAKEGGSPK
jgi:type IV pilus assembly protein PilO